MERKLDPISSALWMLLKVLIAPIVVIVIALVAAKFIIGLKKAPPKKVVKKAMTRVEVSTLSATNILPKISTFGNTSSYLETEISSQVAGLITEVSSSFDIGKTVNKGEWLVKVDPADFVAALANQRSAAETARRTLQEEETRSRLAREDWVASGRSLSNAQPFTLRVPQLQAAKAALEAAEESIKNAQLNVSRTTIRAPFDAVVASRQASPGAVINAGTAAVSLGRLIARDKAEVTLPLTPEQAALVDLKRINTNPIQVTLRSAARPDLEWSATIRRINPVIDAQTRTIQVIAEIPRPFDQGEGKRLPLGAFINATIEGEELQNVYELAESSVVEDSFIWCVNRDSKLVKQPIEIVARQSNSLVIRINKHVVAGKVRMIKRPLASFSSGQEVIVSEK